MKIVCSQDDLQGRLQIAARGVSQRSTVQILSGVLVRAEAVSAAGRLALQQVLLAALTCGVPLTVSLSPESRRWAWLGECAGVKTVIESDAGFVERLAHGDGVERVRAWEPISTAARTAANGTGVTVIDAPVLANGRLELRWYLREQAVSRVLHRYGSVTEPAATE